MDIVTTGLSYNDVVNYQQYRFKNTGTNFELLQNIPGKIYGGLEVFDFNHDGKQDYALNGTQYTPNGFTHHLDLYTNTGSNFQHTEAWQEGTQTGDFKIIDINNDQELDLVIFGLNSDLEAIFKIYKNNNGSLELSQELPAVSDGKIAYADFNNDGFLDLIISGQDENYDGYLGFFLNDGAGNFTENKIINEGIGSSNVQVGDLNNDGYYDFVVTGDDENYDGQTKVFIYQSSQNNFLKAENTNLFNIGSGGSLQLFDFDNDNQLDILMNGFDWSDPDLLPITKLFQNSSTEINQKPNAPTAMNTTVENDKIIFSWSGANDDKTPENVLQYELSVGSQAGKTDISKYVVTTKNWYLKKENLPTEIFWSVKSIDASKVYSDRSEEKNLTILAVNENNSSKTSAYPNPTNDLLHIKSDQKIASVKIYNIAGQQFNAKNTTEKTLDVSHLTKGIYFVELSLQNGEIVTKKIIKK